MESHAPPVVDAHLFYGCSCCYVHAPPRTCWRRDHGGSNWINRIKTWRLLELDFKMNDSDWCLCVLSFCSVFCCGSLSSNWGDVDIV